MNCDQIIYLGIFAIVAIYLYQNVLTPQREYFNVGGPFPPFNLGKSNTLAATNKDAKANAVAANARPAAARNKGIEARVARYHNIFGVEGSWYDGREKAPAAMCRKVAMAEDGGEIEVWGDGKQTRSFLYVEECIEATIRLTRSDWAGPGVHDRRRRARPWSGLAAPPWPLCRPRRPTGRSRRRYA